mmetsp:Transcript_33025/g.104427  ORF Transcript_33025/g.104427 Transcript_33025/m.104427 type:complete len:213 (+) Transcript_33025:1401-2039(+)
MKTSPSFESQRSTETLSLPRPMPSNFYRALLLYTPSLFTAPSFPASSQRTSPPRLFRADAGRAEGFFFPLWHSPPPRAPSAASGYTAWRVRSLHPPPSRAPRNRRRNFQQASLTLPAFSSSTPSLPRFLRSCTPATFSSSLPASLPRAPAAALETPPPQDAAESRSLVAPAATPLPFLPAATWRELCDETLRSLPPAPAPPTSRGRRNDRLL